MTDNYFESESLGIAIMSEKGAFYLSENSINEEFINYLQSDNKKITYNLKRLMGILKISEVKGFAFDFTYF